MWLLSRCMTQCNVICDLWYKKIWDCNIQCVICDICDCSVECDSVTLWHRPMCDLWSLGWQARQQHSLLPNVWCVILCSPMCDASQLVVRTNRPNIDPPFVRCAQYRKYRPAISPRFDGKEYFCPQKSANLCQSITVRHMISHLYQLIFSQSYHKSSSVTAKQKESVFWEWVNILL